MATPFQDNSNYKSENHNFGQNIVCNCVWCSLSTTTTILLSRLVLLFLKNKYDRRRRRLKKKSTLNLLWMVCYYILLLCEWMLLDQKAKEFQPRSSTTTTIFIHKQYLHTSWCLIFYWCRTCVFPMCNDDDFFKKKYDY